MRLSTKIVDNFSEVPSKVNPDFYLIKVPNNVADISLYYQTLDRLRPFCRSLIF